MLLELHQQFDNIRKLQEQDVYKRQPLIPILVMILLVGILQIVLSLVLSSNLKKETLVERIRYQG